MLDVVDELTARGCPQKEIKRFIGNKWNEMKMWFCNNEIERVRKEGGTVGNIENAAKAFKPQSTAKFDALE